MVLRFLASNQLTAGLKQRVELIRGPVCHWLFSSGGGVGPGCGSGGGQPFSCNPTPSLDGAHLTDAARSVLGVRMGTWGLWVGELCPTCFLGGACVPASLPPEASFTHLWQPLQLSSLGPCPLGSPSCLLCVGRGSLPEESWGVCPHKRLPRACFSPGFVAIKVVWLSPWSPLLFTWPLVCSLPWHQSGLEEPLLSNFLPHSPVPSAPPPLN